MLTQGATTSGAQSILSKYDRLVKLERNIDPVFRNRFFFACVGLLVPLWIGWSAQNHHVDVKLTGSSRIESLPGKILAFSVRVSNLMNAVQRVEPYLVLPATWRTLSKPAPFDLPPAASELRLITLSVPAEASVGQYEVRYGVKDTLAAEVTLGVTVLAVRQLEVRFLEGPRFVVAGEQYRAIFILYNRGNVRDDIRLTVRSSAGFAATADSMTFRLGPRDSRVIPVVVRTLSTLPEKVQDVLEVAARMVQDSVTIVRATSSVDVVPRAARSEDQFHRYPLHARFRVAGGEGASGTQLELLGSGNFSGQSNDRVEFFVRTPDIQAKSVLGQRDEYRLSYRSDAFELYAGDRKYDLSPLTEYGRYGFGGGGRVRMGDVTAGAFVNENRFFQPRQPQQGGFVNYRFKPKTELTFNVLRKEDLQERTMFSLRGLLPVLANSDMDVEYGRGLSAGWNDGAYALRLNGYERQLAYDVRVVHSGAHYPGYYHDLDFKTANFNFAPGRNIRIEGYYRDEERNLGRDTTLGYAPRDRFYQLGFGYADFVSVFYRSNIQQDLMPNPRYRRGERTLQVRSGYGFSAGNVLVNMDYGTTRDELLGKNNPFQRLSLALNLRPGEKHNYNFGIEYAKDKNIFSDEVQERISASLNTWLMLLHNIQVTTTIYGARTNAVISQTFYLIDLTVEQSFAWGHTLLFRGRQTSFTPSALGPDRSYMVEYSMPIGVPIERIKTSGSLRGKVIDIESGKSLQNVLLYAGGSVSITDEDGEFSFQALKPDTHYVQIDMASVGLNRVPTQVMPRQIGIKGGEESRLDVGVIRSAFVSGTIMLYSLGEALPSDTARQAFLEVGGHANALLELSSGVEVHRRVTDNRGRFSFGDLRPGQWTLRVLDGNLPPNHYVEKESFDVMIDPGERKQYAMRVLPRRRRIQIIEEGKTIQQAQPTQEQTPDLARKTCTVVPRNDRSGFVVQLAAWSSEQSARSAARVAEKLTNATAMVERIARGFRIRLGAFKTREEAEAMCRRLSNLK